MREAHPRDRTVGMALYASDHEGTGGQLRADPGHFRVTELPDVSLQPLDADADAYPHLIVRVRLRGWDTYGFVHRLASDLGISRERIRWAGTKDKDAITTQLLSLQGIEPDSLPTIDRAELDPIGRFGRGLTFGDLVGNRFELVVSDPERPAAHKVITSDLESFGGGTLAIPNYFGHQRFGSLRPITHEVGLRILDRDWEGAVMTYLAATSAREPADTRRVREYIADTRNWEGTLDRLPGKLHHERRLVERLATGSTADYRDALGAFPRSLRRLFIHAAQSYIFNRIISERFERGLSPIEAVPGDAVCFTTETENLGRVPDLDRQQRVTRRRQDVVNRHLAAGRAVLTAPLVGTDTELGDGEPGAIAATVLEDVGVERADFALPDPYTSSGAVRAVVVRPDIEIETDPFQFVFGLPSGSYATVVMREYLKGGPVALD